MKKLNFLLLIAVVGIFVSCMSKRPTSQNQVESQRGLASWYGSDFHGRKTASGEAYNMEDFTAAHRFFSFGTRLKVTRTDNGKSVVVRINDRGPFIKNRIIDLSAAAAKSIALDQVGVAHVQIEKIVTRATRTHKKLKNSNTYYLQVASFDTSKYAKDYAQYVSLLDKRNDIQVAYLNQTHKVWIGPLFSMKALETAQNSLKSNGIESVILRRS